MYPVRYDNANALAAAFYPEMACERYGLLREINNRLDNMQTTLDKVLSVHLLPQMPVAGPAGVQGCCGELD